MTSFASSSVAQRAVQTRERPKHPHPRSSRGADPADPLGESINQILRFHYLLCQHTLFRQLCEVFGKPVAGQMSHLVQGSGFPEEVRCYWTIARFVLAAIFCKACRLISSTTGFRSPTISSVS